MAFWGPALLGALVTGSIVYHARQTRATRQGSRAHRPHVFIVVRGDADDPGKRRPVSLHNGGDLPARHVSIRVVRDAMIWTSADGGTGGEERLPFSALPACRTGVLGIPPGADHAIGFLTPAGRWMPDREQKLEGVLTYFDGEGARYEESVGLEYLA